MSLRFAIALVLSIVYLAVPGCKADSETRSDERWVEAIQVKDRSWRAQLCSDYLVTSVCGGSGSKGFDDKGQLPPQILVGDKITYKDMDGKEITFTVRNISVYTYSEDLDKVYGGVRYTAKKGDTTCTLYEEHSRSKIVSSEGNYLSTIVVKNCQELAMPENTKSPTVNDLKASLARYEIVVGVLPKEFLMFPSVEQEAYVRGVLDGEYFLSEESKEPDRDAFVNCLNARLKTILSEAKSFVEREGEHNNLMPWTLSLLVGQICPKETRIPPKKSPEYTEATTYSKLVSISKRSSDKIHSEVQQDAIDKAFIRGVLDGKVFGLYGHSYPKLVDYLECLSKPGNLDTIFLQRFAYQQFGENLDKSQAYGVAFVEALICKELNE